MHRIVIAAAAAAFAIAASAQSSPGTKQQAARAGAKAAAAAPAGTMAEADAAQLTAAGLAHYGNYACEFSQTLRVDRHSGRPGYVDVHFGKLRYTMKPVLSDTGALRLEDVQGQALLLQIAYKSMLFDTQQGRRLVDGCVHPKQREAELAAAKAPPQPGLGIDPTKSAPAATRTAEKE